MKDFLKNSIRISLIAVALYGISSCENKKHIYSEYIKIGKEEHSLTEVTINPQSSRDIILSGGNNKFLVNVADSKIATAKMMQDTLKIKGLLEGDTYVTIFSMDIKAVLQVHVRPNELEFTRNELKLYPTELNKTVSLGGGGNIVNIEENDPDDIIDFRWTSSGVLEIMAKHEGEASLIAHSKGVDSRELKIKVVSRDEKGFLQNIGFYNTDGQRINQNINPVLIVKRKEMGTVLSTTTNLSSSSEKRIWIRPIYNPREGATIDLEIMANFSVGGIQSGKLRVTVVEVQEMSKQVVLGGRDFKFVLPYN